MSETQDDIPTEELLAGEYALGVLEQDERRSAEERIERDPGFAGLVDQWIDWLAPLADSIAAVAPPAALKQRLMANLFGAAEREDRSTDTGSLLASLAFWRGAAIAFGAVALLCLALLIGQMARPHLPVTAPLVASLAPPDTANAVAIAVNPDTGIATLSAARFDDLPGGQDTELWVIPEDGTPRSLGVFPASGDSTITLPEEFLAFVRAGALLAVTFEPAGGSPTGAPTGTPVAVGRIMPR